MNQNQGFWNKWNGGQLGTQSGVQKPLANDPKDQIIQGFQASSTSWVSSPKWFNKSDTLPSSPNPFHREFVAIWMIVLEKQILHPFNLFEVLKKWWKLPVTRSTWYRIGAHYKVNNGFRWIDPTELDCQGASMDADCWPWRLWLIHDSQRLPHARCIVAML